MAATFWCFCTLVVLILVSITDGNEIGNRRIQFLHLKVIGIKRSLVKIERKQLSCNETMYSVSERADDVSGILKQVYEGPIYTRMDMTTGYKNYDKVVITLPDAMEQCVNSYRGTLVETDRAEITCLQQILWRYEEPRKARQMRRYRQIVRKYKENLPKGIGRLPLPRLRKEYRTLSETERQRFHDAMNDLQQNGTIEAFAEIHRSADPGAHRGPAFLPWHRMFILNLENALRAYDPTVTLPYWDSSMDDARENPTNSIMWTPQLVGNGAGQVVTGDFQYWPTQQSFLSRAYGEVSKLVSKSDVANMMTKYHFEDISVNFGEDDYILEKFHNNVHGWVGGDMGYVTTAPYDPVFYLHHCYIDYLWEKFREQQMEYDIDPQTDYPDTDQEHHGFEDVMLELEDYTVASGMSNVWTQYVYHYEDTPTCDDNCGGSNLLLCHEIKDCCIPKARFFGPSDIHGILRSGLNYEPPSDSSYLYKSTTDCDQYLDPDCQNVYTALRAKAGLPLQPGEEIRMMEQMVPVNRGRRFEADPGELRNLVTLKEDAEHYERELKAYRAAQTVGRRDEVARGIDIAKGIEEARGIAVARNRNST